MPEQYDVGFVEPFAGMFLVLLNRPKSKVEIINDINDRIVNYARVVRDQPEELIDLISKNTRGRVRAKLGVAEYG